jgi:hypothetical protein
MALNIQQEQCLNNASATPISNAFSGLSSNFNTIEWLKATNPYRSQSGRKIKLLTSLTPFTNDPLIEFIAASVPKNCFEGWGYLGAAIRAVLAGDVWQARHLAYYAELRAAMSILGSQGVGVFDNTHIIIDGNSKCNVFPSNGSGKTLGTHLFTWEAIEHWSKQPKCIKILGDQIIAFGFSLNEWLHEFPIPHNSVVTGYQMLNEWGFDLHSLSKDRDIRNQVSYSPNFSSTKDYVTPKSMHEMLNGYWQLSEPGSQAFSVLDKFIVRFTLQKRHNASGSKKTLEDAVSVAVDTLFSHGMGNGTQIKDFLKNKNKAANPELFRDANKQSQLYESTQYKEVIARAFLLCRLASASTNDLVKSSGLSLSDMHNWWQYEGLKRGLWKKGQEPADVVDMWQDVELAMSDISNWIAANNTEPKKSCLLSLHDAEATNLVSLAKFERIALWALPQ